MNGRHIQGFILWGILKTVRCQDEEYNTITESVDK